MVHKFDFHVHTKYSYDCISSPRLVLNKAKKIGLRGIAITDHETMNGAFEIRRLNKNPNFVVILGEEIKTEQGDIIGLFLTTPIKTRKCIDVIKEIKSQRGIVVIPHPFKKKSFVNKKILTNVDIIEIFNSKTKKKG